MYCKECGNKSEKGDIFCGNCGKKLEKKNHNEYKEKIKTILGKRITMIGIGVIVIFIMLFGMLSSMTSPKKVVQKYMDAVASKNTSKLYRYLDLGKDQTFTTKKVFTDLMKSTEQSSKITKYEIMGISYNENKNIAIATISYNVKDSDSNKTTRISLEKQKSKKFLFFDNWKITLADTSIMTVEDFKIIVPKNAAVTFAGIKVEDKYLSKEESTDDKDIYILKQVFAAKTDIIVTLENGYTIEDEVTPSNYKKSYIARVSLSNISEEEQTKIADTIKKDVTALYEGALGEKTFQDMKNNLSVEEENEETMKNVYDELVKNLKKAYNTLTSIELTSVTLSSVELNEKGYFEFKIKVNYKYNIKYTNYLGEEQNKESSSYSYMSASYNMKEGTYNIVDADDLETYFSRY